jgi:hypothetical protein
VPPLSTQIPEKRRQWKIKCFVLFFSFICIFSRPPAVRMVCCLFRPDDKVASFAKYRTHMSFAGKGAVTPGALSGAQQTLWVEAYPVT